MIEQLSIGSLIIGSIIYLFILYKDNKGEEKIRARYK